MIMHAYTCVHAMLTYICMHASYTCMHDVRNVHAYHMYMRHICTSNCSNELRSMHTRTQETPAPNRGSKRTRSTSPSPSATSTPSGSKGVSEQEDGVPKILDPNNLTKNEKAKAKIRRIVCPNCSSGNLEVPEDIMEMWEDAANGRNQIFKMWTKADGVKAVLKTSTTGAAVKRYRTT